MIFWIARLGRSGAAEEDARRLFDSGGVVRIGILKTLSESGTLLERGEIFPLQG